MVCADTVAKIITVAEELPAWLSEKTAANSDIPKTAAELAGAYWSSRAALQVAAEAAAKKAGQLAALEAGAAGLMALAFATPIAFAARSYLAHQSYFDNRRFVPCGTDPQEPGFSHATMSEMQDMARYSKAKLGIVAQADGSRPSPVATDQLTQLARELSGPETCNDILIEAVRLELLIGNTQEELRMAVIANDRGAANEPRIDQLRRELQDLKTRQQQMLVKGDPICERDLLTQAERSAQDHPVRDALSRVGDKLLAGARFLLRHRIATVVTAVVGYFGGDYVYDHMRPYQLVKSDPRQDMLVDEMHGEWQEGYFYLSNSDRATHDLIKIIGDSHKMSVRAYIKFRGLPFRENGIYGEAVELVRNVIADNPDIAGKIK